MIDTFDEFVRKATDGQKPYAYQSRLAAEGLPDVLRIPTGAGKTLAAILPWLYRRVHHPDRAVRASTPHWLVFVLPQRALVEQTTSVVKEWLTAHRADVPVHVLMGGVSSEDRDWKTWPARERIFVGTQDMVLSRLLMRGFAESRAAWPMSFGLLNAGVQFVFDEVQLMGPGLPTSLQLQGFREQIGVAMPCQSMWMSATLNPAELATVDFARELSVTELDEEDNNHGELRRRLEATRKITRLDLGSPDQNRYASVLATEVLAAHRAGSRTLVVLNTVDRAVATYIALQRAAPAVKLVLLHSRFRPADRAGHTEQALGEVGQGGAIVVTTQVLEAGIDVTSETLITESAPWTSIVQRAGRCNRDGYARDARLLWTPPPAVREAHLPYTAEDLAATEGTLADLEGCTVTTRELADQIVDQSTPTHAVLRRRDLVGLYDTAPDLSGNDIDVTPFIRDTVDRTVSVAWRRWPIRPESEELAQLERDELCPAPIGHVKDLVARDGALLFDQGDGRWRRTTDRGDVRPTALILLDALKGGYTADTGFCPGSTQPVEQVVVGESAEAPEAIAIDPGSAGREWQSLVDHLEATEQTTRALIAELQPELSGDVREAIALAARYHDIGKAHETFIASMHKANPGGLPDDTLVWAKSPSAAPLRHDPKYFRHELVSALLLLEPGTELLTNVMEPNLVAYLALAHHGKVRMSVRARPDEREKTMLGVREGSMTVDADLPGGTRMVARPVALDALRLGEGSLADRALGLRDRPDIGPFRLAFCEALVRAADWQASGKQPEGDRV